MTRPLIVIVALLLAAPGGVSSDVLLLGTDETRVEREPAVAVDDAGGLVVAWSSQVQGGAQPLDCIRLRRIDPDGALVGEEFRIDPLPGDLARSPSVDITPDGRRFVVAWEGGEQGRKLKRRIWARVFGADGKPVGPEIRVEQRRLTHDHFGLPREAYGGPRVSVAPSGEFVVVWRSEEHSSCDRFNITARRFSAEGLPVADEFIVNTDRSWSQVNPDIDHDGEGGFLIVWQDGRWIGTSEEWSVIRGRRFDSDGRPVGEEMLLSEQVEPPASASPSLDMAEGGSFVCAWREGRSSGLSTRIHAAGFDREGAILGQPVTVEAPYEPWMRPRVSLLGGTKFAIVWVDATDDHFGSSYVAAQGFATDGSPITRPVAISPPTCSSISRPMVAVSPSGVGGVVWRTSNGHGVNARRFSVAAPSDGLGFSAGAMTLSDLIGEWRRDLGDHRVELGTRVKAVENLSCRRAAAGIAFDDLATCLADEEETTLRAACATGVAAVAASVGQALPLLRTALTSDEEPSVRAGAARAIGLLGARARSAEGILTAAVGSGDPKVRGEAALALGRIGAVSAIDAIVGAPANETDPYVRPWAIQGLGYLANDGAALIGVNRLLARCFDPPADPGKRFAPVASVDGVVRDFRNHLVKAGVGDGEEVKTILAHVRYRVESDRIGVFETQDEIAYRSFYERIDEELRRLLWGDSPTSYRGCLCLEASASGLANVRPFDRVVGPFSRAMRIDRAERCGSDLSPIIAELGADASGLADTLREFLGADPVPRADLIRALAAVDPGSDKSVQGFSRMLASPRTEIQLAAIEGLTAAGPWAVLGNHERLNQLLKKGQEVVWEPIEDALALAEVETAACKEAWSPPHPEPSPPPMSAVPPPSGSPASPGFPWVPGGGSARPPRPVRTLPPGPAISPGAAPT
ncbi:MAG: HEAT repeat domain-containing protein, partial [Candidatus Sulfomarinibacteraceae bacterium]